VRLPIPPPGLSGKRIISSKKRHTQASRLLDEIEGTSKGHRDGHGFVIRDDGEPDIYLPPKRCAPCCTSDRVACGSPATTARAAPKAACSTSSSAARPDHRPPAARRRQWLVAPEDKRYGQDILIPKNATASRQAGQVVAVELTEPPALHSGSPWARQEVLGEIDDPGMEIEIAVRKYEVPHRFSPRRWRRPRRCPSGAPRTSKHRVDLTDVPLVTIDGEDARDFDDAVYCEPAKRRPRQDAFKGWRLLVAIADVSHYVKPGEPSTRMPTSAPPRCTSRAA
jgi:ribonuclease R